jgi:hypothetical protein
MTQVRARPCPQCPYRRDVPSGVWSHEEYEKLRPYDLPTAEQPFGGFSCHAKPDCFCHGWAVVHSNRGHEHDLIALRLSPDAEVPEPAVPLFGSGNEAADHGQREIETPGIEARKAVTVLRRYPRIRDAEEDR